MKTKTKKPEISFDAEALVARVEGFAAGRQPARERTMKLPPPVKPIPAKQIRAIRLGLGCTQTEFAVLLNVPAVTATRGKTARANPAVPPCACWPWPGNTRKRCTRRSGAAGVIVNSLRKE